MRVFDTGATRDDDDRKIDFEGFLSPQVLLAFGEYMNRHRIQADGQLRQSDNWQQGIPIEVYVKSAFRHFMTLWSEYRRTGIIDEESACALLFNVQGMLHEQLREPQSDDLQNSTDRRRERERGISNTMIR